MELQLVRDELLPDRTFGTLSIDGRFFCFTLEDAVRNGPKIAHETAIACGRYAVIINKSQRFGRMLPLVLTVPEFTGVRIHGGNSTADTSGCILVGLARSNSMLLSSRAAMDVLMPKIADALARGQRVWLTITNAPKVGMAA